MVHYAKYVKKNKYDVPYTDFLPVLINLEKFLPPVPPEICFEDDRLTDYNCFNNFKSFQCLEGALPDDPKEMSFHLRIVSIPLDFCYRKRNKLLCYKFRLFENIVQRIS